MTLNKGYLGDTRHAADFAAWLRADGWSAPETAALMVGVQPNWSATPERYGEHEPVQRQYRQVLSYLLRAVQAGALKEPISPSAAIAWAKAKDIPIPPELNLHQEAKAPRDLSSRERQSLLKMILGMAKAKYRYDPAARASETHQAIADDLAKQGLAIDVDTVRKWLKTAAGESQQD